ncbi:MAG: hypothetical protein OXT09_14420 [Myxococcales bacterium]|nr:hypothetical protein [Myxococcales bacterium]
MRLQAFSSMGSRFGAITTDGLLLGWDLGAGLPVVARALRFVPPSTGIVDAADGIAALTRDGQLFLVDDGMKAATRMAVDQPVTAFVLACAAEFSASCVVTAGALRCAPPCGDVERLKLEDAPRLSGVARIWAGGTSACALLETGAVHCWGENGAGQLATGAVKRSERPRALPGLSGIVEVALGHAHGCARDRAGRVHCWGDTTRGQAGTGVACPPDAPLVCRHTQPHPKPVNGLPKVDFLNAAEDLSCAGTTDPPALYCWGDARRLGGAASTTARGKPLGLPLPDGLSPLGAAHAGAYALGDDNRVYRWVSTRQEFVAVVDLGPALDAERATPARD